MRLETVNKVEVVDGGDLLVYLTSGGKPEYQYIYREARAVYWDNDIGGFKSSDRRDWSDAKWFEHIADACTSIGINLKLAEEVDWVNVSDQDRHEILASQRS